MYSGKPIIGLAGGIGSGKSFVAGLFAELGGLVIDSDRQVHEAYRSKDVQETIRSWWGQGVFTPEGQVDRKAVGRIVFADSSEKKRLEDLIHPIVNARRERIMAENAHDPRVTAFVWDVPLLFETGLDKACDAVVFVDTPLPVRQERVAGRGWGPEELARRENLQMPLDRKRLLSEYTISNVGPAEVVREQVRDVFSRIVSKLPPNSD